MAFIVRSQGGVGTALPAWRSDAPTRRASRPIDAELLAAASVVLVMTRHHQDAIQAEFPEAQGKVYLLSQLVDGSFDIEDPYGGNLDDYELCAADLQNILADGYDRLTDLADRAVPARR